MLSTKLHNAIVEYNVLQKPTELIGNFFEENPTVFKIALIANHFFRTISMIAFMLVMPYSMPANIACCFIGSLFYRLTVEKNCAYKFALPAFGGAIAYLTGKKALESLISSVAFESLNAFGAACFELVPLMAYTAYVVLTVDYDVDNSCCHRQ